MHSVNAGTDPTVSFSSSFQWYSVTEGNPRAGGRHFVAYDLDKLSRYFDERAAQNESMKLLELSVKYERARGIGHIQYVIERHADDTSAFGTVAHGKGAISCDEGKIELMSVGMNRVAKAQLGLCPEPEQRDDGTAVVCAAA